VKASSPRPVSRALPHRRRDRTTDVLVNAFLFCALLPFLAPLPAPSDVQWPAFAIALVIVARDVLKGRFAINWVEFVFVLIGVWSLLFVLPRNPFNARERIGILSSFLIYYVVRKYARHFSTRTLKAAITVTLTASLVQLAMPGVYGAVAPWLVRTVKDLTQGGRGASGPSAEPSFLAAVALVHGLLVIYYYVIGRLTRRAFWLTLGMSAVSLLLSKSATGFMYLAVLSAIGGGFYVFRGMTPTRWAALVASLAILFGLVAGPLARSRGGAVLVGLYQNPDEVLADGSAQERVRCLAIGVLSLVSHPLGAGGGAFERVSVQMERQYRLRSVFERARRETVTGVLNAAGMYLVELGLVFAFFLAVVLLASMRIEVFHLLFSALALMFLSFSFSIAMPMTWLLLGLAARKDMMARWRVVTRRAPRLHRPGPLPATQPA
jgi:hypothetical protein